ncbi:MAG: extracellular solute-binding protein family 1, partial [Paenibacillaceae bacterium]|nr:extracellular solute-binding protein family 1 [Paenibacillaceae bacterium]
MSMGLSVRKNLMSLVVLFLALFPLAACSSGGGSGAVPSVADGKSPSAAGQPAAQAVPINEPATITFQARNAMDEADFNQMYGDAIRKKFPNYTVIYKKIENGSKLDQMLVAGQTSDIYAQNARKLGIDLVGPKLQYDVTELAKKHNVNMGAFEPDSIDQIKQIGGLYGLPVYSSLVVLFYNKDLFDKFGVAYPKDGMTWDQALELSKKLNRTEDGKSYVGYWVDTKLYLRNNQLSASFVDPKTSKATLNNDSWKRIIQTVFRDFGANDQFQSMISKWPSRDIFLKDKIVAMYAEDFAKTFSDTEFTQMNWDMVSLPTFKELPNVGSQATYEYLTIPAFSKQKDAAMEVIKYLTSVEFQTSISKQG